MKKYNLEFCFKGNRTYIHGTDIYNKILKVLENKINYGRFDLSFHGIARSNIAISSIKPTDESLIKFACKYSDIDNEQKILYGIENGHQIDCRYPYLEENISKTSELNILNETVLLEEDTSYTFVENAVALNKFLLENLFPTVSGKWYFTRLELKEIVTEKIYPLQINFKANFNFKLTKSEIFINDKSIGFIYFSLI